MHSLMIEVPPLIDQDQSIMLEDHSPTSSRSEIDRATPSMSSSLRRSPERGKLVGRRPEKGLVGWVGEHCENGVLAKSKGSYSSDSTSASLQAWGSVSGAHAPLAPRTPLM